MTRSYLHCRTCRTRMRKFADDSEEARTFYFCPECGYRATYLKNMNGLSEEWPEEIFEQAIRQNVFTREGRAVAP